jgi:hypothetical protein
MTILQSLAQRGAHIIALSPHPIDSPQVTIPITLLRETFTNEEIYAEQCDIESPSSIRSFCTRFLTGKNQRVDAIIFAHEYQHVGAAALLSLTDPSTNASKREAASLATFLMITLLLPALLVAPVERDIRIISVVNPFYAAAAGPSFLIPFHSQDMDHSRSIFLQEGIRSLRTSIFTRHLQRILDALPSAQVPRTDDASSTIPVVSPKTQRSNIIAVSVSPGISRVDTVAPFLNADWTSPSRVSMIGVMLYVFHSRPRVLVTKLLLTRYMLLQPLLRVFAKSSSTAMQSVLHVLFLPTPFKVLLQSSAGANDGKPEGAAKGSLIDSSLTDIPEEVLKPGALYANCAVVQLKMSLPSSTVNQLASEQAQNEDKGNGKSKGAVTEEVLEIPDDGEFGGEVVGRLVWEAYEEALKGWEKANPPPESTNEMAPDVDQDHD